MTEPTEPLRPRRPAAKKAEQSVVTRRELLDAGLDLLRQQPKEAIFAVLQPEAVVRRAGRGKGTFYDYFDSQDTYIDAMLDHHLAKEQNPQWNAARAEFDRVIGAGGTFSQAILAGGTAALHYQDENFSFRLQLAVWSRAGTDVTIRRRLADMYARVAKESVPFYRDVIGAVGREMRPPYTYADIATALSASMEGLALRRAIDLDAVPDERLGHYLIALLELMTRPKGETEDAAAWVRARDQGWDPQLSPDVT